MAVMQLVAAWGGTTGVDVDIAPESLNLAPSGERFQSQVGHRHDDESNPRVGRQVERVLGLEDAVLEPGVYDLAHESWSDRSWRGTISHSSLAVQAGRGQIVRGCFCGKILPCRSCNRPDPWHCRSSPLDYKSCR